MPSWFCARFSPAYESWLNPRSCRPPISVTSPTLIFFAVAAEPTPATTSAARTPQTTTSFPLNVSSSVDSLAFLPLQGRGYPPPVAVADAASRSRIADRSLAPEGERRIQWVARHSPVLNRLAREHLADGALRGRRIAVVVHLEAKTAYLALLLAEAGAEVVAAGSNPGSTQDAVCAALVRRGVEVHARHGATVDEFTADLLAVADTAPEIVIDDGAELTRRIVEHRPDLVGGLAGVS